MPVCFLDVRIVGLSWSLGSFLRALSAFSLWMCSMRICLFLKMFSFIFMYRLWSTVCPVKPAPNSHPPHPGCLIGHVGTGSTPSLTHANLPALWQAQVFCQHPAWTVTGSWMIDLFWSVSGAANRSWHCLFHWSHWGPARPSFCHHEGHWRRASYEAWACSWLRLQRWKKSL